MKKVLAFILFISIFLIGCYKNDPSIEARLKEIITLNESLKQQVIAMQKTTDSISASLKISNQNFVGVDKKIDSIKNQLIIVFSQITLVNTQLLQSNSNILELQLKLTELQKTCDQLMILLNQCCNIQVAKLKGYVNRIVMDSTKYISIDSSSWNYIAIVKSALNIGKIYKNGNLVFDGSFQNVPYYFNRLDIGAEYYTEYSRYFKGWIDEIRISNSARSLNEIVNSYNSNLPFVNDSSTIGLWHFDDNASTSISAEKGPIGTAVNPQWDLGRYGRCIYYNGTNARASMNMILPTSNLTLEFWFKPDGQQDIKAVLGCYGIYTTTFFTAITKF